MKMDWNICSENERIGDEDKTYNDNSDNSNDSGSSYGLRRT